MSKNIQLTIANPCHEEWDQMTLVEKGRFCGSCQKQVVDFTGMNDAQLVAFFKKKTTGSVCGRFMYDQLDKNILIPRKRTPWVKYFFQFTLPLFLTTIKLNAQKGMVIMKEVETKAVCELGVRGKIKMGDSGATHSAIPVTTINGVITDEAGKGVPYASILIKGTVSGVQADSSGSFSIDIPVLTNAIILEISSVGFESKEILITKEIGKDQAFAIQLIAKSLLPEVVVTGISGTLKGAVGLTSIITTETVYPEKKPSDASLKIYPNPVLSGTSINIMLAKMEEGYYAFHFLNISGQSVTRKEVWIDKEAKVFSMPIQPVAAGTYILNMINKRTGKKFTEKIIIQ
jgi:CarboxypepD_reg-like domain/Secretion system C-terminal sorting domain